MILSSARKIICINRVYINRVFLSRTTRCKRRFYSVKVEHGSYDLHRLDSGPPTTAELTKEDALKYLKLMYVIRKMEKELSNLYKAKKIRGFCHLYSGQEAVGVGVYAAMAPEDCAITSYRCHGWILLMGGTIQGVVAELLGVVSGCARGKGGSMHMYAPKLFGGNGIVGSHVPLGSGIAFAYKYRNDKGICVTLYGDGASNQGQTHESMNLAQLWNLPVLYVAENNIYAMGTSFHRHSANKDLFTKGNTIPGLRVDGMDILAVREATKFCLDYIRSGNGPIIMETVTYRYYGHSMSDPGTSYRTREEISQVRENKDPIMLLRRKILSSGLATEEELKTIEKEAKDELDKALKEVIKDKEVAVEELAFDVYSNWKWTVRVPGYNKFIQHKNVGFKPRNID